MLDTMLWNCFASQTRQRGRITCRRLVLIWGAS
jgi:hypothetical protein